MSVNTEKMKLKRISKRIYQREVAEAIGVDTKTYSAYERGERQLSLLTAKKIADYLEIDLNDFF
jgi:transcriptional regulator with XRE-family HTH domain